MTVFKTFFDILVSLSIEKTLSKLPLVVTVILPSSGYDLPGYTTLLYHRSPL